MTRSAPRRIRIPPNRSPRSTRLGGWTGIAALTIVAGALIGIAAGIVESWHVRVEEIEVARPDIPPAADGFSIVQLSDLHSRSGLEQDREVAARLAELVENAVVITGDFRQAGGDREIAVAGALVATATLKRRGPVYVVAGNNDSPEVMRDLARGGFRVLENEAVRLAPGLWLAGWDPYPVRHRSLREVLERIPPGEFVILLAHSPDVVLEAGVDRAGLILSGHTHGGQIRVPGLRPLFSLTRLGPAYTRGLHRWGASTLYVNRGIGTTMIPLRIFSSPEVTRLTLRRSY